MENQLTKLGFIKLAPEFNKEDIKFLSVQVELPSCSMELYDVNIFRRGEAYLHFTQQDNKVIIDIGIGLPKTEYLFFFNRNDIVGMPFSDFYWYHKEGSLPNVFDGDMRDNIEYGDLTYIIPTRFARAIIEVLELLSKDQELFHGILSKSIMYGLYV